LQLKLIHTRIKNDLLTQKVTFEIEQISIQGTVF